MPRLGASNEYPQHMFSLRNKKDISIFQMKKLPNLLLWPWNPFYLGWDLSFTILLANSADDRWWYFLNGDIFLIFHRKLDLTFHANCLHWRQFAWNIKSCFLGKLRKKKKSKCRLLKILPKVLSVKCQHLHNRKRCFWSHLSFCHK